RVLVDGRQLRSLGVAHTAVIDGDDRCFCIACASIVAKVTRDRLMGRLSRRYPGFGWDHNCGYATEDHVTALSLRGPTPHHRRSFLVKERFPRLPGLGPAFEGATPGEVFSELPHPEPGPPAAPAAPAAEPYAVQEEALQ
ncbi:MAG: ribonuclease HII, partial [Gemmatimonadaceae bacterium]